VSDALSEDLQRRLAQGPIKVSETFRLDGNGWRNGGPLRGKRQGEHPLIYFFELRIPLSCVDSMPAERSRMVTSPPTMGPNLMFPAATRF
jgi:hypothetical protein